MKSSRNPPKPQPPPPPRSTPPATQARPKTVIPPERFFKRRTLVYTGAVAVIVIAGSILGSQLKSRQQAQERREALLALEAGQPQEQTPGIVHSALERKKGQDAVIKPHIPSPTSDIQRQIAFLEDRRGRLMGQKLSLEQKLASVREKMKREEELIASRRNITPAER